MPDPAWVVIAGVFVLAGLVKGVIGVGLPTISMGLLALVMRPLDAAAILVIPSAATNIWRMLSGSELAVVARRLWPMMLGVCFGTWLTAGVLARADTRYGVIKLGAALTVYGASGLGGLSFSVGRAREWWVGPVIGGITGAVTAVTGVFVLPATPYLQAIGLEKERLVQALGLSFTVSTFALAADLASTGSLGAALAGKSTVALLMALIGMRIGQALRLRLKPATFRRWFFSGLCALGLGICLQALH